MIVRTVMSAPVVTVAPHALVHEIAALLVQRNISGVPVVADGRVVGIVSEGDLLHRVEIGTDRPAVQRSWWRRLIEPGDTALEYVRTHALQAQDIMTTDVVTVAETTPLAQVASIIEQRRIRRVPVLRNGRPVGIVTRADLVAAIGRRGQTPRVARAQSDDAIRARLLAELWRQPWWRSEWSSVWVTDGVVRFHGLVESEDQRRAARVAAENVPGVRAIVDERVRFSDWQPLL
jgi:CBS domain-containing protein